jgi:hypothetical protein
LADGTVTALHFVAIPLAIGVAILRHRLWDIDLIINRTLVYGSLTLSLALVYFGLVVVLQSLVQALTGVAGQQPLVIVACTLVIAALFQPLRRSIQSIILVYTLLILVGHIMGFLPGYAYLHTVCASGCSLTPENVLALKQSHLSIAFYANLFMALIYRYRRLLNGRERAATKWLIVSWSVFIPVVLLLGFIAPAVVPADSLASVLINLAGFFACGINIAGALMAVLYANAFDFDVFVRRTLVYTLLTAILALLYAGLVVGAQFMFATFSPQAGQSPLILVASTLVIAALFQPLRHRLQQTIDRRFYRQKYDARLTIERFSTTLQSELDLEELSKQLVAVVQETMQPSHVSLWLRPLKWQASDGRIRGESSSPVEEQSAATDFDL